MDSGQLEVADALLCFTFYPMIVKLVEFPVAVNAGVCRLRWMLEKLFDGRKAFQLAAKKPHHGPPSIFMLISNMVCRPDGPITASYWEQQSDSFVYLLHGLSSKAIMR